MANCHKSLSSFFSFKQRKSWVQLWKYLLHTLGKLFFYFMGRDPGREQMKQHDPFCAGEAKWVKWKQNNSPVSFAAVNIYWNILVYSGSYPDIFVTYDSLTPAKSQKGNVTLWPTYRIQRIILFTSQLRYTGIQVTKLLRLIHILLSHIWLHLSWSFPGLRRGHFLRTV